MFPIHSILADITMERKRHSKSLFNSIFINFDSECSGFGKERFTRAILAEFTMEKKRYFKLFYSFQIPISFNFVCECS